MLRRDIKPNQNFKKPGIICIMGSGLENSFNKYIINVKAKINCWSRKMSLKKGQFA